MKFTTMEDYITAESELAISRITDRENVDFDKDFVERHLSKYKGILNQLDFELHGFVILDDSRIDVDMAVYNEGEEVDSIYPTFTELSPGFWVVK